jgi:ParB family chromosome partitioning protein
MTINTDLYADTTAPVLEHLDPKTLTIGLNIRSAAAVDLDPEFLASVKDRGVLEPVIAWRDPTGAIVVKAGQRRVLAAIVGERPLIPVYIHATEPDTYARIVDQWAENHQRKAMNLTDEVAAVDELALFGVPADLIASTLGWAEDDVVFAQKVSKSTTAKAVAVEENLTLEYAALVAEFDTDEEVEYILRAASNGYAPDHIAEHLDGLRAEEVEFNRIVAEMAEQGISVVKQTYGESPVGQSRLTNLKASEDATEPLTEETHADCAYRGARVSIRSSWAHQKDPEANPDPWERTIFPVCLNWPEAGHVEIHTYGSSTAEAAKIPASELPDEEREAKKAERKRVVESNKAWKEATSVRAKWLLGFGKHKEPMVGAEKFVGAHLVTWIGTSATHLPLVGLDRDKVATELNRASAKRASHLVTCVVVASIEDHLTDDAWRSQLPIAGPYLDTLSKWGYGLSEIETRMIEDAKAEAKGKKR